MHYYKSEAQTFPRSNCTLYTNLMITDESTDETTVVVTLFVAANDESDEDEEDDS